MGLAELLRWQWQGYPAYHLSRANLLLHLAVVPLFWAGNIALLAAPLRQSWLLAVAGLAAMLVSIVLQGRGHAAEANPPVPFTGPGNAIARIFLEQWVSFPRFVASGHWRRALYDSH